MQNSIRKALAYCVKERKRTRLGDLLVQKGYLSQEKLSEALTLQEGTGLRLGDVLHSQNYLSKKALRYILFKQTTARMAMGMSIFALSIMMTFGSSSNAEAQNLDFGNKKVTTASVFQMPKLDLNIKNTSKPLLFGKTEKRSKNLSAFTKFTDVVSKIDTEKNRASTQKWAQDIMSFKSLTAQQKVNKVNAYVNQVRFVHDSNNYGQNDYWASPSEFFRRGKGDCEDFALAKYTALQMLGFKESDMRIAIVQDLQKNVPHAILIVYIDGEAVVLDNQIKTAVDSTVISHYKPIYSINQAAWWRHG